MKTPTSYEMHEVFVEPARPFAALWRLIAGLVLALFVYLALNQFYFQTAYGFVAGNQAQFLRDVQSGATPVTMYLLLFSFSFMTVAAGIAAKVMHKRSFATLFGPVWRCWNDFWSVSLLLVIVLFVTFVLPPWGMDEPLVSNLPIATWVMLLVPSLMFVLIQTSAEEVVFRGYVQQQLAARFRSPLVWMVLPAVLFALGHYLPDSAGENAIAIALWAGMFGLLMADLTARAGTLGPAIAVHFWNNVSAILIVSLPGDLSGLALYLTPFGMDDTEALRAWLPVDFVFMIVLWLTARLAIRR